MKHCIVFYDDDHGCWPYGLDPDCEGALSTGQPVALFPNRKSARRAINISKKFAQLQKAQGKIHNTDFTDSIAHVKIRVVVFADEA